MPATDFLQEASSFEFHISSSCSDQIHSMESKPDSSPKEFESEAFQRHVCALFQDLASDDLLSVAGIHKLLDTFLCCLEEFRAILSNNKSTKLNKPPMDRYLSDFLERSVKALDVCNAIRDGIEQIRQWQKLLEIVLSALDNNQNRIPVEAHFRRAKKALVDLAIAMLDHKEKDTQATTANRNRSFGRSSHSAQKEQQKSFNQFRSLSWSVSSSWSAAKQLQAISTNIAVPRATEIASTDGLNVAVFTMNHVLLFVMWALVAAIPCQDRGLQINVNIPRQFIWGGPVVALYEKIVEESKKRGKRNACGLLKEIHDIEICTRHMNELTDSIQYPLNEEKEKEVKERVQELRVAYEAIKSGMNPLERHVREVFQRIVKSRTERLDSAGTSSQP